jgi:hypothetical protein
MSIDRQYGLHELPGSEQPAPVMKRETVSAGFELQMRGYVNAIWAKIATLEHRIDDFEGWRTAIAEALKSATGIDPRISSRPVMLAAAGEGGGRKAPPVAASPRSRAEKPWEAEGVSRRTYFRRKQKEEAK